MKDWILYYAIFVALGFLVMGLIVRYRFKDKIKDLDE